MAGPVTGFGLRRLSVQRTAGPSASLHQSSLSRLEAPFDTSTPVERTIGSPQTPFESVVVRSADHTNDFSTTDTSPLIESPDVIEPSGSPDIISEQARSQTEADGMSWGLRTETVRQQEEYSDPSKAADQGAHTRQLTHYRNLLVRAQSSSSSELHELHSRLHDLENRYRQLEEEHAKCAKRVSPAEDTPQLTLNNHTFTSAAASMSTEDRMKILGILADLCYPSDIDAQIALLRKYKRTRFDILGRLPEVLAPKILDLLELDGILALRRVSRRYQHLVKSPDLWKSLCCQIEWRDCNDQTEPAPFPIVPGSDWEALYRSLWEREKNWERGQAQKIRLLKGHTNYVTSVKLHHNTLISGSYDGTIRIWDLSSYPIVPVEISAKSVSCLDYLHGEQVIAAGSHDVGRVQIWRRGTLRWEIERVLSGHLHGVRAVALNDHWLVSVGADKLLVAWDWRTGEKITKFGQQANLCAGVQLNGDQVTAITVEGHFKISQLGNALDDAMKVKLKSIGSGIGGAGMVTWFEGQGRFMTCGTREIIIRFAWEETEESRAGMSVSPTRTAAPTAARPAVATPQRRAVVATPLRQPSSSRIASAESPHLTRKSMCSPLPRKSVTGGPSRAVSPTHTISTASRRSLPLPQSTPIEPLPGTAPISPPCHPNSSKTPNLGLAPKVLEVISVSDIERGAIDLRGGVIASTRFASRPGADRQIYLGVRTSRDTDQTRVIPVGGAWADQAETLGLQTPGKNPMSLALDRDKFAYGCADGSVIVADFMCKEHVL